MNRNPDATILQLVLAAECLGDELARRVENCTACVDCSHRDISDSVSRAYDDAAAAVERIKTIQEGK